MVQESSQLESRHVTMPPVTTLPESGSRRQTVRMASRIAGSAVSTVALIQLESLGAEQNTSGLPKEPSETCAAILRHMSQPPPGRSSSSTLAGVCWSPKVAFSTQPPSVM